MKYLILFLFSLNVAAAPFSFTFESDIHAASLVSAKAFTSSASNDWYQYTAWIPQHTNDGTNNIVGEFYGGDLYEQDIVPSAVTNSTSYVNPVSVFSHISNNIVAGLLEIPTQGNHDSDNKFIGNSTNDPGYYTTCASGSEWNNWLGTNVLGLSPYFAETMVPNDTRVSTLFYTNQGVKLAFYTMQWATNIIITNGVIDVVDEYTNQINYITNSLAQNPDHLGIVICHYALGYNGYPATWDTGGTLYTNIGPSIALTPLFQWQNFLGVLSGHNRMMLSQHQVVQCLDGHWAFIIEWDPQAYPPYCQMFDELTFEPALNRLFVNAYDISRGRYMTNGETRSIAGIQGVGPMGWGPGTSHAFTYSYSLPLPTIGGATMSLFPLR